MLAASVLWAQAVPAFEQFRVSETFSGKPAPPVLRTAADREFRTRIREGAPEGPNFAGHYTIVQWGCGAGCVSMALVDAKDGRIYPSPFKVLSWIMAEYESKLASNDDKFEPLMFQTNSRLLIARGCPEEDHCASYFYEWTGTKFNLLRKIPAVAK